MEQQKPEAPEMMSDEWFKQVNDLLDSIDVAQQGSQRPNDNSLGNIIET